MKSTEPATLHPRQHRTRRYTFLALLLLALAAPAGLVAAGETSEPYIVVFDESAVTRAAEFGAAGASGRTAGFRQLAMPSTMRIALAEAEPAKPGSEASREVDEERVVSHVRELAARVRIPVDSLYTSVMGGFATQLTPSQLRTVARDPAVGAIVPDVAIELDEGAAGREAGSLRTTANPAVRVQPGVRRIGARSSRVMSFAGRDQRIDADVAILDTGIERDHPDLNVVGGYNCTSRNRENWGDVHGHGTHVAGIVGAIDNRIGVVGVAPGARLWSVKVLDKRGRGFLSWMACGVDWVTAQRERGAPARPLFEVANMSISFGLPASKKRDCAGAGNDPLHQAICRSVARGTVYVVAAGNEGHNARRNRPGAYESVITVSAMADYDGRGGGRGRPSDSCPYWSPEPDDAFASFSNYGTAVDLIAPGKCILSTYRGKRYAWMSGTSMATPHVSGAAAIYRSMYPRANPQQVRLALQAIGTLDWRTATDRDQTPERAVWIGSFRQVPDFALSVGQPSLVAAPGDRLLIPVALNRVGGFNDLVTVSLEGASSGFVARRTTTRGAMTTLAVELNSRLRHGRYTLTIVARSGQTERSQRVTVQVRGQAPRTDTTPPRAPVVTLEGDKLAINLERLGVDRAHVGHGGTLWVRGGTSGVIGLEVSARDPESGIAANRASVRGGSGWSVRWSGPSAAGALRLHYAARGGRGELRVSSINGAGLEGAVTVGWLMRDAVAPRAVEWVSAPSGTTVRTRAPSFRLDWRGGSDTGSGLAPRHLIRRYRAPLNRDGECLRRGFRPDGVFRLAADGSLESGLVPNACYVWSVRTLDNVGNYPASIVSGEVITKAARR